MSRNIQNTVRSNFDILGKYHANQHTDRTNPAHTCQEKDMQVFEACEQRNKSFTTTQTAKYSVKKALMMQKSKMHYKLLETDVLTPL
uniref:Uncharacterized protein n=1 Tax=Oryza brachyantha TaxID=4533 RepID=J3KXG1_ORYBR